MLDDTWCFVPCDSGMQACVLACLLNEPSCIEFIHSLVFMDSKRPVTKKILQRIDISALLQSVDRTHLTSCIERELGLLGSSAQVLNVEEYVAPPAEKIQDAQYYLGI